MNKTQSNVRILPKSSTDDIINWLLHNRGQVKSLFTVVELDEGLLVVETTLSSLRDSLGSLELIREEILENNRLYQNCME